MAAAKYITLLDLRKGYWHIPLTTWAQRYATFASLFGTFRFLVMAFRLINVSYRFSKFMATLLGGYKEFCVPYVDDT